MQRKNVMTKKEKSDSFETIKSWTRLFKRRGWEKTESKIWKDNEGTLYENYTLEKEGIVIRICKGDEFPDESPDDEYYGKNTFVFLTIELNGFKTREYFLGRGEGEEGEIHLDSKKKKLIGSHFEIWHDRWGCENVDEEEEFSLEI